MTEKAGVVYPEIEARLAAELGKTPISIRFYACRMARELELGRQMTPAEQRELYKAVWGVFQEASP